jgi:pyrroloquinoline quinone biosynthesis protein B
LGSSAGGGTPQWNCGCKNCCIAREDIQSCNRRTQSSIAVSDDEKRWILFNASPDICTQITSFSALDPSKGTIRGSAIDAVILTDGEMDHIVGLLSLREQSDLHLVCTKSVQKLLTDDFPILRALENYCTIRYSTFPFQIGSLVISAFNISEKNPRYAKTQLSKDSVIGVRITSTKTNKILVYLPCLTKITEEIKYFVEGCNCLLIDGTFWSNEEMILLGITERSAYDMGHVPINGKNGSLDWLCKLDVPHKIYIHINNTNPILLETSMERKIIDENKIKVGYDGMDILI